MSAAAPEIVKFPACKSGIRTCGNPPYSENGGGRPTLPDQESVNGAKLLVDLLGGDWQGGDTNSHGILDRVADPCAGMEVPPCVLRIEERGRVEVGNGDDHAAQPGFSIKPSLRPNGMECQRP